MSWLRANQVWVSSEATYQALDSGANKKSPLPLDQRGHVTDWFSINASCKLLQMAANLLALHTTWTRQGQRPSRQGFLRCDSPKGAGACGCLSNIRQMQTSGHTLALVRIKPRVSSHGSRFHELAALSATSEGYRIGQKTSCQSFFHKADRSNHFGHMSYLLDCSLTCQVECDHE